jgi:hypothetical protein
MGSDRSCRRGMTDDIFNARFALPPMPESKSRSKVVELLGQAVATALKGDADVAKVSEEISRFVEAALFRLYGGGKEDAPAAVRTWPHARGAVSLCG